jgi:serine/threonine protein kinase
MDGMEHETKKGSDLKVAWEDIRLIDTLGTGTFGKVILVAVEGRDGKQRGFYAMKVLEKETITKFQQVEHVSAERSILGRVRHPNLVNL